MGDYYDEPPEFTKDDFEPPEPDIPASHDGLMSNPELRELYHEARDDDMEYREALEHAVEQLRAEQDDNTPAEKAVPTDDVCMALQDAVQQSSWWVATDYEDGESLEKAPGIWRRSAQVPDAVRELVGTVISDHDWRWDEFISLDMQSASTAEEIVAEKLTQPQGWSIRSIAEELQRVLYATDDESVQVASDMTHVVLNTSKEAAFEEAEGPGEEFQYDWVGPTDHRTTPTCRECKQEIQDRGGSVTMPTLRSILRQKAQEYEGDRAGGGTPDRVDQWLPHYNCRHTLVRRV